MEFLILPHQLFDKKYLDKNNKYIIYEHPQYFTKYKFNMKKLILHRASMKYYYDYLKKNDYHVKYIDFDEKIKLDNYKLFDPIVLKNSLLKMTIKLDMQEIFTFQLILLMAQMMAHLILVVVVVLEVQEVLLLV